MTSRAIRAALAVCALALVIVIPARAAYTPPPDIPWETLLPALPGGTTPQPHPVSGCARLTIGCIDSELRRMRAAIA